MTEQRSTGLIIAAIWGVGIAFMSAVFLRYESWDTPWPLLGLIGVPVGAFGAADCIHQLIHGEKK